MFDRKAFITVFGICFVFSLAFIVMGLGFNSYSNDVDWGNGFSKLADAFGGVKSFGGIILFIVIAAVVIFVIMKVAEKNNLVAGLIGLAFVILAAAVGNDWMHMPNGAALLVLAFIVLVTVLSLLLLAATRGIRRTTPSASA